MVVFKKIILTPADIIAMFAIPQAILPTPPVGSANAILGISHELVFNTAAYTGASVFHYQNNGGVLSPLFTENSTLVQTANYNCPVKLSAPQNMIFITTKEFLLTTDALAAGGDSDIIVCIAYEQKVLS